MAVKTVRKTVTSKILVCDFCKSESFSRCDFCNKDFCSEHGRVHHPRTFTSSVTTTTYYPDYTTVSICLNDLSEDMNKLLDLLERKERELNYATPTNSTIPNNFSVTP